MFLAKFRLLSFYSMYVVFRVHKERSDIKLIIIPLVFQQL